MCCKYETIEESGKKEVLTAGLSGREPPSSTKGGKKKFYETIIRKKGKKKPIECSSSA